MSLGLKRQISQDKISPPTHRKNGFPWQQSTWDPGDMSKLHHLAFGRWRQEDHSESEASLSDIVRSYLKQQQEAILFSFQFSGTIIGTLQNSVLTGMVLNVIVTTQIRTIPHFPSSGQLKTRLSRVSELPL